jgi:hypothetical protein
MQIPHGLISFASSCQPGMRDYTVAVPMVTDAQ